MFFGQRRGGAIHTPAQGGAGCEKAHVPVGCGEGPRGTDHLGTRNSALRRAMAAPMPAACSTISIIFPAILFVHGAHLENLLFLKLK